MPLRFCICFASLGLFDVFSTHNPEYPPRAPTNPGPHIVPIDLKPWTANKQPVRTDKRAATIIPQFVGVTFHVHNGMEYVPVNVTQDMVGTKLGEYAYTRKPFRYRQTKN